MSFQKGCESYDVDQKGILTARFPAHYGKPDATLDLNTCIGMNSNFWGPYLEWNSSGFISQISHLTVSKEGWRAQMECTANDGGWVPGSKFVSIDLSSQISIDSNFKLVFSSAGYQAQQQKLADEQAELAKQPVSFTDGVKEGWAAGGWIGGIVGGIGSFF